MAPSLFLGTDDDDPAADASKPPNAILQAGLSLETSSVTN